MNSVTRLKLVNPKVRLAIGAFFIYIIYLFFNLRSVFSQGCSNTILGWPGDNLGFQWLHWASPSTPWWGFTGMTNYPLGESLWQPAYITGQLFYLPYWIMAKIFGPTCGHTMVIAFGFLFSAMITFCFLRWLLKYKGFWAPLFGGFAATFTPYLLIKTPVHSSYVFFGLLIILVWLFMMNYSRPTLRKTILLGILLGLMVYHDPYFVLLGGLTIISLIIAVFVHNKLQNRNLWPGKQFLRSMLLVFGVALITMLPAAYVRLAYSGQINNFVEGSRGAIMDDARAFSARPWEYILPEAHNPFSPDQVKEFQQHHKHGSNLAENGIYIGWTVIVLAAIWLIKYARREKDKNIRFVGIFAVTLIIIAGLLSLPPKLQLGSLTLYLPSFALLSLTEMWRVLSRLYILVQIGFVILATLGFYRLILSRKIKWQKIVLIIGVFIAVLIDFAISLPGWNLKTSHETTYQTIKNDPSVDAIAEYPLRDPPGGIHYNLFVGYQMIHGKKLLNSSVPASNQFKLRQSLYNLEGWQTIPILRSIGIDMVVVHMSPDEPDLKLDGAQTLRCSLDTVLMDKACLLRLTATNQKDFALVIGEGFDGPSSYLPTGAEYYIHLKATLQPKKINMSAGDHPRNVSLQFYAFEKQPRRVEIRQNEKVVAIIYPGTEKQTINFVANPAQPIQIIPENATLDYSLVISNMAMD